MNAITDLSTLFADAIERAASAVVQVQSHRRPSAGLVFADDLVVAPARAVGDEHAVVRTAAGKTIEGQVLGHAWSPGLAVVRVPGLGVTPAATAPEPRVGTLVAAVGRTWSGGTMATLTSVAVVGGPLRTGRASQIERVIRIAQEPHGALSGGALIDGEGHVLGMITGAAIRGTTVVLPATLAVDAAHQIVKRGGTRQGFLGVASLPVALPARQGGEGAGHGLLVTAITPDSPADAAGLLVGDIIMTFANQPVADADTLVTLLRGDHVGKAVTLGLLRGVKRHDLAVTVGERTTRRP